MCMYLSDCDVETLYMQVYMCMWKPEVNIRYLSQSLFILLLGQGLLLNHAGMVNELQDSVCLYSPVCGYKYLPVYLAFMQVLEICISNFSVSMIRYYDPEKFRTFWLCRDRAVTMAWQQEAGSLYLISYRKQTEITRDGGRQ